MRRDDATGEPIYQCKECKIEVVGYIEDEDEMICEQCFNESLTTECPQCGKEIPIEWDDFCSEQCEEAFDRLQERKSKEF